MQIEATGAEGLKRMFRVVVPAEDVGSRISARLEKLSREVRIHGFRPGKIPAKIIRQRYAAAVRDEIANALVQEGYVKALKDNGLTPALDGQVSVVSDAEGSDFEFTITVEVLPEIEIKSFKTLRFERLVSPASDALVETALMTAAARRTDGDPVPAEQPAGPEDVLVIDYVLSSPEAEDATPEPVHIHGPGCGHDHHHDHHHGQDQEVPEAPGTSETHVADGPARKTVARQDFAIRLGTGGFPPGVEEALAGVRVGETRVVDAPDPNDPNRMVRFTITVKEVRAPRPVTIDDELARQFGAGSVDELRRSLKAHMADEHNNLTRSRMKRLILDRLAEEYDFAVPEGLVDGEFQGIWERVSAAAKSGRLAPEDVGRSEEDLKAEYRAIAERRIRLGLLLSAVGRQNNISVSQEELFRAALSDARDAGVPINAAVSYYREHQDALERFRSPIYEQKVVDFITEMVEVEDREVSPLELRRAVEDLDNDHSSVARDA